MDFDFSPVVLDGSKQRFYPLYGQRLTRTSAQTYGTHKGSAMSQERKLTTLGDRGLRKD